MLHRKCFQKVTVLQFRGWGRVIVIQSSTFLCKCSFRSWASNANSRSQKSPLHSWHVCLYWQALKSRRLPRGMLNTPCSLTLTQLHQMWQGKHISVKTMETRWSWKPGDPGNLVNTEIKVPVDCDLEETVGKLKRHLQRYISLRFKCDVWL